MNEPILELKKVTKSFGKKDDLFVALKDINLKIYEGESIAIVGKSGSGKSTLMHLMALLDRKTTGEILLNGKSVGSYSRSAIDKVRGDKFGFVFQQFFMNSRDTVLENVALPLKISGVPKKVRRQLALDALKAVDLEDKIKNKANDLSGGQKQRVCIARALVNNPEVIFADEPTGNLDSQTGQKVIDLLFNIQKEKKITLIIVTHDNDLAKLCSRQIHITDGKISSDSTSSSSKTSKTNKIIKKIKKVRSK